MWIRRTRSTAAAPMLRMRSRLERLGDFIRTLCTVAGTMPVARTSVSPVLRGNHLLRSGRRPALSGYLQPVKLPLREIHHRHGAGQIGARGPGAEVVAGLQCP